MTKPRLYSIDNIRGILTVLMVIGHSVIAEACDPIVQLGTLFHIPLYIVISGLYIKPITLKFFRIRAMRLILPVIFILTTGRAVIDYVFAHSLSFFQLAKFDAAVYPVDTKLFLFIISLFFICLALITLHKLGTISRQVYNYAGLTTIGLSVILSLTHAPILAEFQEVMFWGNTAHTHIHHNWHNFWILWFLPMLFTFSIAFAMLIKFSRPLQYAICGFLLLFPFFLLPKMKALHGLSMWGIDIVIIMLPIAFICRLALEWYNGLGKEEKKNTAWRSLAGFIALLIICHWAIPEEQWFFFHSKVCLSELVWPGAIWQQLLLFALNVCALLSAQLLNRITFWTWIGQYSIIILFVHLNVLFFTMQLCKTFNISDAIHFPLTIIAGVMIPAGIGALFKRLEPRLAILGLA